ncbi:MAG TPA: response regulator [Thermoanaerobaculia bacterium]|nr:response regulator [Thermoanaerobaculia bacterium]
MKILVVEDQAIELKLAVLVLSAAGHDVTRAEAADQALASIRADEPDLILMDLWMPGIDGLMLVRRLKADRATRDIHIVAVTSYPEKFSRAEAIQAGCDAYLGKPLNTRDLPEVLAAVVENAEKRSDP